MQDARDGVAHAVDARHVHAGGVGVAVRVVGDVVVVHARGERRTIGAHESGDVGARHLAFGEQFERAQHGVVEECAALHQCKLCQNHCKLTITTFHDGSRYVTGNRCERGGDAKRKRSDRPNLYDFKYKRAFAYRRLTDKKATRGEIGIPRVLNMYENYPFWFTLLTSLGFKVVISMRSTMRLCLERLK